MILIKIFCFNRISKFQFLNNKFTGQSGQKRQEQREQKHSGQKNKDNQDQE